MFWLLNCKVFRPIANNFFSRYSIVKGLKQFWVVFMNPIFHQLGDLSCQCFHFSGFLFGS